MRFSPIRVNAKSAFSAVEPWTNLGDVRPMKTHPNFLRPWRKKMKLTQVALASRLGADHTTIGRYERGELGVDEKTFRRIADIYGISVAELSSDPSEQNKSQHMHRIMAGWSDLDEDDAKSIADMVDRIARARKK